MAVITPNGTAANAIIIVISAVPTIAGKIPPFVIPSLGNSDKNDQLRLDHPPTIVTARTAIMIKIISSTENPLILTAILSFIFLFILTTHYF
jgi:hypothetical protein